MKKLFLIAGCVLIALVIACGCAGENPSGPLPTPSPTTPLTTVSTPSPTVLPTTSPTVQQTTTQGGTSSVAIQNFAFAPGVLAISRGTTVTWVNQDTAPHQVVNDAFGQTAQGAYFTSSSLARGAQYSFMFTEAGVYRYHCSIHPSMTGTITVT